MSRGQRPAPERAAGRGSGGAVVRGLLLIAVAVLLGVVLLNATDETVTVADDGTEEVSSADPRAEPAAPPAVAGGSGPDDRAEGAADTIQPADPDGTETESGAEDTEGDAEGTGAEGTEGDAGATEEGEEDADGAGEEAAGGSARRSDDVTVLVANGSGVSGRAAELTEQVGEAGYRTAAPSNVGGGDTLPASTVYYTEGYEAEAQALASTLDPAPQVAALPESGPVSDLRGAQVVLVLGADLATD